MSNDNVVNFTGITKLDLSPERVLNEALKEDLDSVIVIGWTKDGEEYVSSSVADGGTVLWHLERTKLKLLRHGDV